MLRLPERARVAPGGALAVDLEPGAALSPGVAPYGGELFPLPSVVVEPAPVGVSRSVRKRVLRRRRVTEDVNGVIDALNWCAGASWDTPPAQASPQQIRTVGFVRDCVVDTLRGADARVSEEEALRSLLHGRLGYEREATNPHLATFRRGKVSLPADASDSPYLTGIVTPFVREHLDDLSQRMLRTPADYERILDGRPLVVPYMDPVLKNSKKHYVHFVKQLKKIGLVRFLRHRRDEVIVFFVKKRTTKPLANFVWWWTRAAPTSALVTHRGWSLSLLKASRGSSWTCRWA